MTTHNQIKLWLYASAFMVLVMIFIGGLTRLSNAGLSIVEWKPVTGIIPPISDPDWQIEFIKYQTSPEFKLINNKMNLSEFKHIFWLEFIHRILARMTGLIICLPLLYFYISGKLSFKKDKSYLWLGILLITQGIMGWLMVKSGLNLNPHVSHFRLAMHLIIAIILYHSIINKLAPNYIKNWKNNSLMLLLYIQIFLGALTAGLKAGMIYNTFPLMGGSLIPHEFFTHTNLVDLFYDPSSIQFLHRSIAYILTIACAAKAFTIYKSSTSLAIILLIAISAQVTLGILTLIYIVPIALALLHQLGAASLLTIVHLSSCKKF